MVHLALSIDHVVLGALTSNGHAHTVKVYVTVFPQ